ncbi:MAG: GNAT family N-acetyltransferase [Rhizonema sp. PD37]|nr:GNAT family N-acetyltransferase [Rhizonema sp. PD37]
METERLVLRRWLEEDLEPFAQMNADPQVMEYYPACLSKEQSELFVRRAEEKFAENGFGFWAIELKEIGAFIGLVGLNIANFEAAFTPCVEIGWRLGRIYWGQGYATEGANASLNHAFNQAKLSEVLSWTYSGNIRSRKVMERIGMTHDPQEDFDHPALPEGHVLRPHVLYRIKPADDKFVISSSKKAAKN